MSVAATAEGSPRNVLATPRTYNIPRELGRQVWRLACRLDEERPQGASESGLMEVAWEMLDALSDAECMALVARTFVRRNVLTTYTRKSYSLPIAIVTRIGRRLNHLKDAADAANVKPPTLWLLAEAAQIHLIELQPAELEAALDRFDVRRKRPT